MGEVDAVFSEPLGDYPALELRWLAALHEAKLKTRDAAPAAGSGSAGGGGALSLELVMDLLAMNEEASGC